MGLGESRFDLSQVFASMQKGSKSLDATRQVQKCMQLGERDETRKRTDMSGYRRGRRLEKETGRGECVR